MRLLALAALVAMAAVVSPARASHVAFTGMTVQVVRLSAGEIVCIRAPCTLPAAGVAVSAFHKGALVARARTNAAGRVRIPLVPGVYAVRVPRLAPENGRSGDWVVVRRNELSAVRLTQRAARLPQSVRD